MNREAPDRESGHPGDTISRNTIFAFATQMSTAFFTAILTVYLVRALGPEGFGTFALATGITGLVLRPSDLGTTQSAARFVAERHGDTEGIVGVLGMALRTRLLTAAAIALALFAFAGLISDAYNAPELAWPLRGVAVALFGQSILRFVVVIMVALRRISRSFTLVLSESAMEAGATVGLVLLGGGATGAAFGRAVGYVFGGLLGVLLLARLLGRSPLFRTGPSPVSRREFVTYAGAMFIVVGAFTAFTQIDVLLIGAILSTSAVAFFSAPLRLIGFLAYPAQAAAQGVAPRLARRGTDGPPNLIALERAIRYVVILQAALVAFVTVWADPVVRLVLGSKFAESGPALRALAPYVFLVGFGPVLTSALNYVGEGRRRIPIAVGALALNAAIDLVLIPKIGILGAAVGTDVAYGLYAGAHLWLCHRLLGLSLKPIAATTTRALLAAGAMAAVLALAGTGSLSALQWLAGLAGGGAAFTAVLLLTGEVSPGELRSLPGFPLRAIRSR
jgi:O-antigen/teichoic acid export membrane protein